MATCPWCGHPKCDGTTPSYPHHSLCCLDRSPAPCWGPSPNPVRDVGGGSTEADTAGYERSRTEPDPDPLTPTYSEAQADEYL